MNSRFLYKDAVIKNAALDFDTFGSLQLDLKVIDVVMINEFDEDNQLYACHQISCEFDFKIVVKRQRSRRLLLNF